MANNTNWLNISSQSGSSGQTILTLSANKNLSTNYKTAEITAYNPVYNVSAKTYVTLEAYSPYIELSPTLIPVADSGGTFELSISANCSWVIAYPDLVSSYSTTAGTGNRTITFRVPSTTADTTLVGNIVVTDESGQVSRTARIEQYGSGAHISLFPVELYFDSTGGSKTFSVSADCAYNVSMASGADWARVTPDSGYTGQTTFTVTVNSGYTGDTQRVTTVLIDAPGTGGVVAVYQNKPETRVVVTYNVTSTTDPTKILGDISSFSKAELADGTEITLGTGYTFPSTGSVKVYYTLTGTSLKYKCFSDCTGLTNIFIPETVTSYGADCFSNTGLRNFAIPDSVTNMGGGCFFNNQNLSSVTIGSGVTSLPAGCFWSCTTLTEVVVPPTVTSIGQYCFSGSGLETIYFSSSTPPTLGNTALDSGNLQQIIVPCVYVNAYITAWPQYAQYISCQDDTTLYFITDTSNVKGIGETRTITILNTNVNSNDIGLTLPSDFPQQGSYTVDGMVIYLTYPRNPSSSATRSWTIGVVAMTKDGVSLSGSYRITQNANVPYSIPYTADTSTVNKTGETRTITIDTSNLVASSITIGVEGSTGVTYTYENGVITIIFPQNNGGIKEITVTIGGITLNGEGAGAFITYTQLPGSAIYDEYLTFTIASEGDIYWYTSNSTKPGKWIYYSLNGGDWKTLLSYSAGDAGGTIAGLKAGDSIRFKGDNAAYASGGSNDTIVYCAFSGTATFEARGNLMSLIDSTNFGNVDTLASGTAFSRLFVNCKGIISAENLFLGANTLTKQCYREMFSGCTNLTKAPLSLPATELADRCYDSMFKGCTKLVTTPTLPATALKPSCYYGMFANCKSLTTAPALPATTLAVQCYCTMFMYCENLVTAPAIPVMVMANSACSNMFRDCTSLATVPPIGNSATTMATCACTNMFLNCTSLVNAPALPATTMAEGCYYNMFSYCTSLTTAPALPATTLEPNCYSHMFAGCTSLATVPPIGNSATTMASSACTNMFGGCTGLVNAPALPATTMAYECYREMFIGCTSLVNAPALPATTMEEGCYFLMFDGCTSLTSAPELPATTLDYGCYRRMFINCTSLVNAPALPATTLASNCYREMFSGCTSLVQAPELPATDLNNQSYERMFYNCVNLNYVKCLAASYYSYAVNGWLYNVSSTGTFVTPSSTNWTTGNSGIPSGWTRVNSDT